MKICWASQQCTKSKLHCKHQYAQCLQPWASSLRIQLPLSLYPPGILHIRLAPGIGVFLMSKCYVTDETEGPRPLHCKIFPCWKSPRPFLVTSLESKDLRVQRNCHGWKVYMDSYMSNYKIMVQGLPNLMLSLPLRGTCLMQIPANHASGTGFEWESRARIITWSWSLACVWSCTKVDGSKFFVWAYFSSDVENTIGTRWRKGLTVYKHTSHPSNIRIRPPIGFLSIPLNWPQA